MKLLPNLISLMYLTIPLKFTAKKTYCIFWCNLILITQFRSVTAIFWQARLPQRPPHQRHVAAFYSAKSRPGLSLGGLASRGGPAILNKLVLLLASIPDDSLQLATSTVLYNHAINYYKAIPNSQYIILLSCSKWSHSPRKMLFLHSLTHDFTL